MVRSYLSSQKLYINTWHNPISSRELLSGISTAPVLLGRCVQHIFHDLYFQKHTGSLESNHNHSTMLVRHLKKKKKGWKIKSVYTQIKHSKLLGIRLRHSFKRGFNLRWSLLILIKKISQWGLTKKYDPLRSIKVLSTKLCAFSLSQLIPQSDTVIRKPEKLLYHVSNPSTSHTQILLPIM